MRKGGAINWRDGIRASDIRHTEGVPQGDVTSQHLVPYSGNHGYICNQNVFETEVLLMKL